MTSFADIEDRFARQLGTAITMADRQDRKRGQHVGLSKHGSGFLQPIVTTAVGRQARHLARVSMGVMTQQCRHVLVVVSERKLGVKECGARLETAARRLEEASAVGVSDTVNGDDVGLVEARGVVGAGGVAGVVVDEAALELREDRGLALAGATEGGVGLKRARLKV